MLNQAACCWLTTNTKPGGSLVRKLMDDNAYDIQNKNKALKKHCSKNGIPLSLNLSKQQTNKIIDPNQKK